MKLLIAFFFAGLLGVSASTYSQQTKFNLKLEDTSVKEVFKLIEEKSEFVFFYNEDFVDVNRKVTIDVTDQKVEAILDELFKGTKNSYKIYDRQIVILTKSSNDGPTVENLKLIAPQKKEISGTVKDSNGLPLPGTNISVKGTPIGILSDADGNFKLSVPTDAVTLVFSFVGMKTQEINLTGQKTLNLVMEQSIQNFGEIVVTALGITREKKALGYSTQSVDTKSLTETRDANLLNMLSGKVSGVQIIPGGSSVSSTRVVIRGNSSITGNNQPLYVIDGMPIMNEMGILGELDYGNAAGNINPDEIESIEVLKGPNASALYGSDAANGVILITTKKATHKQGFGIFYNSNIMFNTITEYPDYQNVYGAGNDQRIAGAYNMIGGSLGYNPDLPLMATYESSLSRSWGLPMLGFPIISNFNKVKTYSPQPDNVKEMYKTGRTITNSLALDKLTGDASIRFSYTNTNANDNIERCNIRHRDVFSLKVTSKSNRFLSTDFGVQYTYDKVDNRVARNTSRNNPLYEIMFVPRDVSPSELKQWKQADGTPFPFKGFENPYWYLNEVSNADDKHWILANLTANLNLAKFLKLRLRAATDFQAAQGWSLVNMYTFTDVDGRYFNFSQSLVNNNFEGLFSYNKRFKKIAFLANAGASYQKQSFVRRSATSDKLSVPDLADISNAAQPASTDENHNGKIKESVFGNASISYNSWLYFDVTARNDWSSTLPIDNNSYFYYSASTSILLKDLLKIKNDKINFVKIRASLAKVGNDTGFDNLYNGYNFSGFYLTNPYYVGETIKKNPNIKPERTTSYEAGSEIKLFNNRLNFDFSYYSKLTADQIISIDVSSISGYLKRIINAGKVKNWGFEFTANVVPIEKRTIKWTSTINWSMNRSMVKELNEGLTKVQLGSAEINMGVFAEVGKPFGAMYGPEYKKDNNGNVLCDINARPLQATAPVYYGSAIPDWLAGWHNTVQFGDFDLVVLVDSRKGGILFSSSAALGALAGVTKQSLADRDAHVLSRLILGESNNEQQKGVMDANYTVLPGADPNNLAKTVPYLDQRIKGFSKTGMVYDSSVAGGWAGLPVKNAYGDPWNTIEVGRDAKRFIYDGSFIKLRELSFGYNIPKKLLNSLNLKSLRISIVGRNLAILYKNTPQGIDPEATSSMGNDQGFERSFALPSANYGFDLKLSF